MTIARNLMATLFITIALCFVQIAGAATVTAVKGKKVKIRLDGEPAAKGDIFYLINSQGKKKALIKIKKIKGESAYAIVGKGKAQKGYTLKYRPKKGGKKMARKSKQPKSSNSGSGPSASSGIYWGALLGFAMNNMEVKLKEQNSDTIRATTDMSGNGFSAKALMDYHLFDGIWFRGNFGVEQFNASGDALCGEPTAYGQTCNAEIMYLSLDLWGRYVFGSGSFRPWAGAGFSLMFPLSTSSTALSKSSITNTSVMAVGGGLDWHMGNWYIPVQVEYGILPSSNTVSASVIAFRAGVAFPF